MTLTMPASGPDPCRVELLVAPGFVATELAAALDCLRLANRLSGKTLFRWRIASASGETTTRALGDLEIVTEPVGAANSLPDLLVVVGGRGTLAAKRVTLPRIQRVRMKGGMVVVLSDASAVLLQSGAASRAAVHWENRLVLAETGDSGPETNALFLRNGNLLTCAGMVSTYDAMLVLIAQQTSGLLVTDVARVLLLDRVRTSDAEQPKERSEASEWKGTALRRALRLMEERIEDPLSTEEVARAVGLSMRQVERIFMRHLKMSPLNYYRGIRLQRARVLVESSGLSLTEIALAVGFDSPSSFSRNFTRRFGQSPARLRRGFSDRAWLQAPEVSSKALPTEPRLTGTSKP